MASVSVETSLSIPVARQLLGVRIEIRVVGDPHVHDPIVLANATAVEAPALKSVRDLPGHGLLLLGVDVEPLEDVGHQPVIPEALVGEDMLAGDLLLELAEHHVLQRRVLLEVLHVLGDEADLVAGKGMDRVVQVGLIGSSPDGITVLLQAVQVDDLDVGVVLAGDLAVNNDGHEATVAGRVHQELVGVSGTGEDEGTAEVPFVLVFLS